MRDRRAIFAVIAQVVSYPAETRNEEQLRGGATRRDVHIATEAEIVGHPSLVLFCSVLRETGDGSLWPAHTPVSSPSA